MCARRPPTAIAESCLPRSARGSAPGTNHQVAAIEPTLGVASTVCARLPPGLRLTRRPGRP